MTFPLRFLSLTKLQEVSSVLAFNIFLCRVLDHGQFNLFTGRTVNVPEIPGSFIEHPCTLQNSVFT
jgi:hypothetical protein